MIQNTAGIFYIDKDGKLLVCHPTGMSQDTWSIPKGKLEEGETALAAAIRETFEEANLDCSNCTNIVTLPAVTYVNKRKRLHPFLVVAAMNADAGLEGTTFRCNSNVPESRGGFPEMDAYRLVDLDIAANILHESQVRCLPHIIKILDKQNDNHGV